MGRCAVQDPNRTGLCGGSTLWGTTREAGLRFSFFCFINKFLLSTYYMPNTIELGIQQQTKQTKVLALVMLTFWWGWGRQTGGKLLSMFHVVHA